MAFQPPLFTLQELQSAPDTIRILNTTHENVEGNIANAPLVTEITLRVSNYVRLQNEIRIENDPGAIILKTYSTAADRAFNVFNFSREGQPAGNTATEPVYRGDEGVRRGYSFVRVRISNFPVLSEEEVVTEGELVSDNVPVLRDDILTIYKLYEKIMYAYLNRQENGASGQIYRAFARRASDQILVHYQFLFVRHENWQPRQIALRAERIPTRRSTRAIDNINREYARLNPVLHGMGFGGAEAVVSNYAKVKDKMYIRRNLDDFFIQTTSCISVPITQERLCFPMAFMRCQLREWVKKQKDDLYLKEFVDIRENNVQNLQLELLEGEICPVIETSFFKDMKIRVFDCVKKAKRPDKGGKLIYQNEMKDYTTEEIECWKWCAIQLHSYVEDIMQCSVDVQSIDECLIAYSFVFRVNIVIYAMEMKGDRVCIHTCNSVAPTLEPTERFVSLLLQNDHFHAISNIRAYNKSQFNPHPSSIHSYCDFCNVLNLSRNKESQMSHVSKCYSKELWKEIQSIEMQHEEEIEMVHKIDNIRYIKEERNRCQEMCTTCYKPADTHENCLGSEKRFTEWVTCTICNDIAPKYYYNEHKCYMKAKKPKEILADNKIFVYDIESTQKLDATIQQYVHSVNLVCLKAVYDDRQWRFYNIPDFVKFLLDNKEMHGSTIFAHNGGGYDHQFVLRYMEDNSIAHETIPRPNTLHKYLKVKISMTGEDTAIHFLDFLMFMTDSLKNIGNAFKLDVCKGDFPHKFSIEEHQNYVGCLPKIDAEEDWYGFKTMKDKSDLEECRQYWESQKQKYCTCYDGECSCTKLKWDYKKELEEYCWKDVYVLAGAVKAYRDQALHFEGQSEYGWRTEGIEPYQYMTQSQIALALFLQGKENNNIAITHEKKRAGFNPKQILWMEELMEQNPVYKIQHCGNSFREWFCVFTKQYLDGYCPVTKHAFRFLDCYHYGCKVCYPEEHAKKEMHPTRRMSWPELYEYTQKQTVNLKILNNYAKVVVQWEHEYIHKKDIVYGDIMQMRDFFYGGRTEVFANYANMEHFPEKELLHLDVCSLYPYVCSWKELPMGIPTIHFGLKIDKSRLHPNSPNPFFGFARVKVIPNKQDLIAILPHRTKKSTLEDEKLVYDLNPKVGCWHTEMIYLAIEHGYIIEEVYEVWDYPTEQRSSTLMRGYMEYFLRMKQEAEGWEKLGKNVASQLVGSLKDCNTITEEDKDLICGYIYNQNGGFARPRKDKVEKNPVLRQLAKIFLNCLWGKLCQKQATEYEKFIYGYKQYLDLMCNMFIDVSTLKFRRVSGTIFKVRYQLVDKLKETNRFLNVPIAASVTAHSQVKLMRQMYVFGPRWMLYCDTDSIMALRDKNASNLSSSGLGNWEDEHPKEELTRFWALAPKCFMIEMKEKEEVDYHFKCKGVRATEFNRRVTSWENIEKLINADFLGKEKEKLVAEAMTIHPNSTNSEIPYGTLCTRYGNKVVQTVFTKRKLSICDKADITDIQQTKIVRLLPFGYEGEVPSWEPISISGDSGILGDDVGEA